VGIGGVPALKALAPQISIFLQPDRFAIKNIMGNVLRILSLLKRIREVGQGFSNVAVMASI
jgi:hypothetical protein